MSEQLDRIETMLLNQKAAIYAIGVYLLETGSINRLTSEWKGLERSIRPLAPWARKEDEL